MNLTELKASAELAKASQAELELWQMEISPEDVLRLVEVALAAKALHDRHMSAPLADDMLCEDAYQLLQDMEISLEGIEP